MMAEKNQTFDPKDINSIKKFADQLANCSSNEVDDDFLLINIRKAIIALKQINKCDYETEHTRKLLKLIGNITIHCLSTQIMDEIIKQGLHSTLREIVICQLEKSHFNYVLLNHVYTTLMNLTGSLKLAIQNQENGFYNLTINLLNNLSVNISNTINNNESFGLYDRLIIYISVNAKYKEIKESLIKTGFVECLSNEFNKLKKLKESKSQIKYIMLSITKTLARLLNDNQLETLPLSNDIMDQFISALDECITNSKTTTILRSYTKYYIKYSIGDSFSYQYALSYLECARIVAVNDTVKQKLFEKGIMTIIEEILIDGNQRELYCCIELLCTLCFNQNVIEYLKKRKNLQNMIIKIKQAAEHNDVKASCVQIEKMLAYNESQRKVSTKPTGHIMISYNHKYKNECLKINNELNKRGYKTWMDVNSSFNDLYDAMAEAIENAAVVLVCYSYEYKTSNNCRLEVQYAFKLNKDIVAVKLEDGYNPDGWLGLILAGYLYVNFSKDIDSPVTYSHLFKQIDTLLNKSNRSIPQQKQTHPLDLKSVNNPVGWKNADVQKWLMDNNLNSLAVVFKKFDGIILNGLWEMKQKDYTQFTKSIEREIEKSKVNVDLVEKIKFYKFIDTLFTSYK